MYLSVVIPVYNSEALIENLIGQLTASLEPLNVGYEVILVCDNSPDKSWAEISRLSASDRRIKGVLLRKNVGQHNAIILGMKYASGKYVVTMDDDLQHSPMDIPELLKKIEEGFDVVYCNFKTRSHAFWKIVGSQITNWLMTKFSGKPVNLHLSPFRIIHHEICEEIVNSQTENSYIDGIILRVTENLGTILVVHHKRIVGKSNYGLRKSMSLWLRMLTNNSTSPLRAVSYLGVLISFASGVAIIALIIERFQTSTISSGWSSLMVTIIFLGGIQLVGIGILGEYLGRVFSFTSRQPLASIKDSIGINHKKAP